MPRTPVSHFGYLYFVDSLSQAYIPQRYAEPATAGGRLGLHAVCKTALGELHVVVNDEHLRYLQLL
jgi:hypothetical protein